MSYHKALEVLGVSEGVVEEERARRLGELGVGVASRDKGIAWGPGDIVAQGGNEDKCGGFFAKKRRSMSEDGVLGTTLPGEVAFAPNHVRKQWKHDERMKYYDLLIKRHQ